MRTVENKVLLKNFLLEGECDSKMVVDGEALLWSGNWSKCF